MGRSIGRLLRWSGCFIPGNFLFCICSELKLKHHPSSHLDLILISTTPRSFTTSLHFDILNFRLSSDDPTNCFSSPLQPCSSRTPGPSFVLRLSIACLETHASLVSFKLQQELTSLIPWVLLHASPLHASSSSRRPLFSYLIKLHQ
jgi:hypothetical protein